MSSRPCPGAAARARQGPARSRRAAATATRSARRPGCPRGPGTGTFAARCCERPRDRRAVSGRPVHPEDGRLTELRGQDGAAAVPAARVHGDDPLHRAGLLKQGIGDMRKPGGAVVRDDDCGDDVLRIRLVRRQGDPVAAQGVLPAGPASARGLRRAGFPVNDTRSSGPGTARRRACQGTPGRSRGALPLFQNLRITDQIAANTPENPACQYTPGLVAAPTPPPAAARQPDA